MRIADIILIGLWGRFTEGLRALRLRKPNQATILTFRLERTVSGNIWGKYGLFY